jgi:hypothetical protein
MSSRSLTERRAHWVPDAVASKCTSCAEPFTLTRRKHHCRRCGFIFCAPCVARNIFLHSPNPDLNYKSAVRVCSKCYDAERKLRDSADPSRTKPAVTSNHHKAPPAASPVIYDTLPVLNDIPDELRDNVWFFSNIDRKTAEGILQLKGVNGSFIVRPSSQKGDDGFVISCIRGAAINHYLLHCVKAVDGSFRYVVDSNKDKHMLFVSITEAARELRLTPLVVRRVCDCDVNNTNLMRRLMTSLMTRVHRTRRRRPKTTPPTTSAPNLSHRDPNSTARRRPSMSLHSLVSL